MGLSKDLISQFVKVTSDKTESKKETTTYGTVKVESDGSKYVILDGSDISTPISTTSGVKDGDRVLVMIKNHTATVIGNMSAPSATTDDIDDITTFKVAIVEDLNAEKAKIKTLQADNVVINNALSANNADISQLKADNVTITKKLTANEAEITSLKTTKLDAEIAEATYATIENLDATNAYVHNLESTYGKFVELTTDKFAANDASIENLKSTKATIADLEAATGRIATLESTSATIAMLESDYLTANEIESIYLSAVQIASEYAKITTLESDYAKINLANVKVADIGTVLANAGLITTATIVNGHVTGYLDSVEVNADKITAGTLAVDRLIISGTDKSIVYALNNAGDLVSTEVDTINGDIITKRTIAADHIIAGAITANELHSSSVTSDKIAAGAVTAGKISVTSLESIVAKIGSFTINNALYTSNHSAYNSAVDGVYVGSDYISLGNGGKTWLKADGSVSIGSGGIKYNAVTDTLEIIADSIKMGSEHVVTDADLNALQAGGENLLLGSKDLSNVSSNGSAARVVLDNGFTAFECVGNWKGVTFKANDIIAKCKVFDDFTFATSIKSICAADLYFFAMCYDADGTRVYPEYADGQNNSYKFAEITDAEQDARYSTTFSVTQGWIDLIAAGGTVWWSLQMVGDVPVDTPLYFYAPKLERGNIPSDWSPNYADVESRILEDEAKITILSDAINSTVGTTESGWKKYTEMVQKYDSFTWTVDQTAVVATETQYALGDSSTTAPTSGWGSSVTWTDGKYTWMKTRYKYANGSYSDWTTPVCITGNTGVNGKDATRTPDTIIHKDYTTTTYWLIAKSTSVYNSNATYGYIRVWGNAGAYESEGNGHIDLNIGLRSSPSCILTQRDATVNTNKCNIVGYLDSDGHVKIYAVLNGYANATLFTEGLQYTVVNSTSTTAPTGTLIFDLSKMTAQNAQTATNYMDFSSAGLVIGDMTADTLGKNVLIDLDSVDIRNGSTTLASFGADYLYLAKNSRDATIDLCNGLAKLYHNIDDKGYSVFNIDTRYALSYIKMSAPMHDLLVLENTNSTNGVIIKGMINGTTVGGFGLVRDGYMVRYGSDADEDNPVEYAILDTGNFTDEMDTGWKYGGVLGESFTIYSNDDGSQCRYRKMGNLVEIRGTVRPTQVITGSADNHTIFTLPEGYRPDTTVNVRCQGSGSYSWLLSITSGGLVRFARYNDGTKYVDTSTTSWLPFHAMFFID